MPPKSKKSETTSAPAESSPKRQSSPKKVKKDSSKATIKYSGNIEGVTNPALKRLLHRAGVKLSSSQVPLSVRQYLMKYMNYVVGDITTLADYAKRKTVKTADVRAALALSGQDLVAGWSSNISGCPTGPKKVKKKGQAEGEAKKKHKARPGTSALRDIRRQQKASDCLAISKQPFQRLVREVAQNHNKELHFSPAAVQLLQLAAEDMLIKLFENANLITLHAKRSRVFPVDIELAATLLDKPYW